MKKETTVYVFNSEKITQKQNINSKPINIEVSKIKTSKFANQSFYKPITKLINLDEF